MCRNTTLKRSAFTEFGTPSKQDAQDKSAAKADSIPVAPSILARYTCASVLMGFFAVWGKYTFVPEAEQPGIQVAMHSYKVPLGLTVGYLISLPLLRYVVENFVSKKTDMKVLLTESMILYNVAQVFLNGWMVYRFINAVLYQGHPFIGDISTVNTGAPFAVFVHYMDKYLEFFDTYFMVLRGKMDQVSFLHVYHHCTIAWAWWAAISLFPGGDSYFGALLNSWIHVMMYSYYALALLKVRCPWKRYLTQAQLLQFTTVVVYSFVCMQMWPKDLVESRHYLCIGIQVLEMVSLFVLFFIFYRKSYGGKRASGSGAAKVRSGKDDDQCQKAVAATMQNIVEGNVSTLPSSRK